MVVQQAAGAPKRKWDGYTNGNTGGGGVAGTVVVAAAMAVAAMVVGGEAVVVGRTAVIVAVMVGAVTTVSTDTTYFVSWPFVQWLTAQVSCQRRWGRWWRRFFRGSMLPCGQKGHWTKDCNVPLLPTLATRGIPLTVVSCALQVTKERTDTKHRGDSYKLLLGS